MKLRSITTAWAILMAGAVAQPAIAQTFTTYASTTLDVTATVSPTCRVSTTPVKFGDIDVTANAAVLATGGLSVTCTSGTVWAAVAAEGQGTGAMIDDRRMTATSGTQQLAYSLFVDSARTNQWQDDPANLGVFSGTGTGAAQTKTIYGRVPAGQTSVAAGDYADVVGVTLYY